ncbi:MAG TPA: hypothetical protein VK638_26420 [Edaphobacter sp.]|nr:hypothetical protein [Edaphobacter sp.]
MIYNRGQTYAEHSPTPASLFDHQKGYIDFWLHFVGVENHNYHPDWTNLRGTMRDLNWSPLGSDNRLRTH